MTTPIAAAPLVLSAEPTGLIPSKPEWMLQAHHIAAESSLRTPLNQAAAAGDEDTADELLCQAQASVSDRDEYQETALHMAAQFGHKALVKLLVKEHKAEVDPRNIEGWTPLCYAFARGHIEVAKVLLKYRADGMWTSPQGWTLLHIAAWFNQLESVRWLLDHNMDPTCQTMHGARPFDLARPGPVRQLLHERMVEERATTRLGVPRTTVPSASPSVIVTKLQAQASVLRRSSMKSRGPLAP